jgi:O-antigen ligase
LNLLTLNQVRILSLLCCLIVPFLVTGPFLPDLLLSLLSLWFLYYTFKHKLFYVFQNKFFYIFLLFCLCCIFSSLLSDNIFLSFESSLFYFRIGIFCLLISFLISQDKIILKYFYYTLLLTFSVLIFYALIEYIFHLNKHPSRISSFFGEELILGSYLSRLLPLITALFFIRKNKSNKEKNFFLIFFALTYLVILISGERAAFFYVNLTLLIFIFFIKINKKKLLLVITIFLSIFFIFMLSIKFNETGKRLLERYTLSIYISMNLSSFFSKKDELSNKNSNNLKTSNISTNKLIIFTKGHEELYLTAFKMFLDRPIIGHGPKMFRVKCSDPNYSSGKLSCMTHPHNFYIQLIAETGIVGFSFLFGLFVCSIYLLIKFYYFKIVKKNTIYSNYQICLLTCLLITVWPFIPNGNFFNNYLMILYCLPFGFIKNKN